MQCNDTPSPAVCQAVYPSIVGFCCCAAPLGAALRVLMRACSSRVGLSTGLARPQHVRSACLASLKPIGYTWPYLACRLGHLVWVWWPCMGPVFPVITETNRICMVIFGRQNRTLVPIWQPLIGY
jgi:hypothetical protein